MPLARLYLANGAGGLTKQSILWDAHSSTAWDSENTGMFNIQLLPIASPGCIISPSLAAQPNEVILRKWWAE
jgi:hypothetical protein